MNELLSLAPPSPWQPSGAPASSLSCPSWSTSRGWTSGPGSLRFRPSRSFPRTRSAWPWMLSSSIGFLNRCERLASCRCLWCLVVGRFWVLQVTFGTCGYFPIQFWTCCRTTMWASAGLPPPPSAPSSAPTLSRLCSVKGTEQPACLFFFGKWTNVFIYLGLQGQYFEDSIAGTVFWKSDCRDSIASKVMTQFTAACSPWGICVERVEVKEEKKLIMKYISCWYYADIISSPWGICLRESRSDSGIIQNSGLELRPFSDENLYLTEEHLKNI